MKENKFKGMSEKIQKSSEEIGNEFNKTKMASFKGEQSQEQIILDFMAFYNEKIPDKEKRIRRSYFYDYLLSKISSPSTSSGGEQSEINHRKISDESAIKKQDERVYRLTKALKEIAAINNGFDGNAVNDKTLKIAKAALALFNEGK